MPKNWEKIIAASLSFLMVTNLGLFSASALAKPYEVQLNQLKDSSPKDQKQFGLTNVLIEGALLRDSVLSGQVKNYCERIQKAIGTACLITPWNGETPQRIVEALQQMYFEGVEVNGGMAKLVGLVIIGEVPLPVVRKGDEAFPSVFPYTDLSHPTYIYLSDEEAFLPSSETSSQAEIWHGLIRPPGKGEERVAALHQFFEKNELFYSGKGPIMKDQIGFHDQFWENSSFDNEAKSWYEKKMQSLDKLFNYEYSGKWLNELSGESVKRFEELTAEKLGSRSQDANQDLGFDAKQVAKDSAQKVGTASKTNPDVKAYGEDRLKESVPDMFSPGAIRNLLKDYLQVVQRYVSGTSETLDQVGLRQQNQTLASLITVLDKVSGLTVKQANDVLEQYLYSEVAKLQMPFELVSEIKRRNEFATPPALDYEISSTKRVVNGVPVESVKSVDQCSIERGSNLPSEKGERGKAVTMNRKDDPLTAQDIVAAAGKGRKAKQEIKKIFKNRGYCSYTVKDQCVEGASQVPLLDYASSEPFSGDTDFRRCLNHDGPVIPKDGKAFMNLVTANYSQTTEGVRIPSDVEDASFVQIPSIMNHVEPTGDSVKQFFEKKMAHFLPIDALRHVDFFLGGADKESSANVGTLSYPNFFSLQSAPPEGLRQSLQDRVSAKEKELRKLRVEVNWKRYAYYLALSSSVAGRSDFWNYNDIPGFDESFATYRAEVLKLLRAELDPEKKREDFEVVEEYLTGKGVKAEAETKIQELLKKYFPQALAHENLDLKCSYTYEIPPLSVDIKIPKVDPDDLMAFEVPTVELPKVNPPSIKRTCDNTMAKSTVNEVKTLRDFYSARDGVRVDLSILHNPHDFIEKMDPKAVALVLLGPVPFAPPLPAPTAIQVGIKMLDDQVKKLDGGSQPVTHLSRTVKPVALQVPGELSTVLQPLASELFQAARWLSLSIEGKHKEGLPLLAKDKVMTYAILSGDSTHIDFTFSNLQENLDSAQGEGKVQGDALLAKVKQGEADIQKKLEEKKSKRALEAQKRGEKPSVCSKGDSVPLLKWPSALQCWMKETLKGPIIEMPNSRPSSQPPSLAGGRGLAVQEAEVIPGDPAKITWDFGDRVAGMDHQAEGILQILDASGKKVRGEPLRVTLTWEKGMKVNGQEAPRGEFFVINGELALRLDFSPAAATTDPNDQIVPRLHVEALDPFDSASKPPDVTFDTHDDYRLKWILVSPSVVVGQSASLSFQVTSPRGVLSLDKKSFLLKSEIQGVVSAFTVPMKSSKAEISLPSSASAGSMKVSIEDSDFGNLSADIPIVGESVVSIQIADASIQNSELKFQISGHDRYGNSASLKKRLVFATLTGKGGVKMAEKTLIADSDSPLFSIPLSSSSDRLRLEVKLDSLKDSVSKEIPWSQGISLQDAKNLSFQTPYLVLGGSAFGDYRTPDNIASSILFSDRSSVQAITTELTPHWGEARLVSIWPSGRINLGSDIQAKIVLTEGRPTMVFATPDKEIARLRVNPVDLKFQVITNSPGFTWKKSLGKGKAILVSDSGRFENSELIAEDGSRVAHIENDLSLKLEDPNVELQLADEDADVLILEFVRGTDTIARWYLGFSVSDVLLADPGALSLQLNSGSGLHAEVFYGGDSTAGARGLRVVQDGEPVRLPQGQGRASLAKVRESNGEGFSGDDTFALAYMAGNTVGESTLLQSEGMVNLGDPVIARQGTRKDYSIGQFIASPQGGGSITHLLRLDVEGDGQDDLLLVVNQGDRSTVSYLQGNGEGKRWGEVSDLLSLGKGVKDVKAVNGKHLLVLYNSGQMMIQSNLDGKFVESNALPPPAKEGGWGGGLGDTIISRMAIADLDQDHLEDLVLLTGSREVWILYGKETSQGYRFGADQADRQLLTTIPVSLENLSHFKSAFWVAAKGTPTPMIGCHDQRVECQIQYFKAFSGFESPEILPEYDPTDRLAALEALQSGKTTPPEAQDDSKPPASDSSYLVRLDKSGSYENAVKVEFPTVKEGTSLNVGQKIPMKVTVTPVKSEDQFALQFDPGDDFKLSSSIDCDGCSENLSVSKGQDSLLALEGELQSPVTLSFTLEYRHLPDFSFQILKTNNDEYPDIGINVGSNDSGMIQVFESRGKRKFADTNFGSVQPSSPLQGGQGSNALNDDSFNKLSDLMRGIGVEGKSQEEIKAMILQQEGKMQEKADTLMDTVHQDENKNGYPDVYEEVKGKGPSPQPSPLAGRGSKGEVLSWFTSLVHSANAQQQSDPQFRGATDFGTGLQNYLSSHEQAVETVSANVATLIRVLKCSRGCLPLPLNFAFLAPGPINVLGVPAGFDPGVPVFGLSPAPFFIWPPLVPYQATQFRIYISPTLTLGVGIALCAGPYLVGQCFVFAVPMPDLGQESVCAAFKQAIRDMMRGITEAVGEVQATLDSAANSLNQTGVIKAKTRHSNLDDASNLIGVNLAGARHKQGVQKSDPKITLQPIPRIFVEWWDRQWEEIINSLTDLPKISIRVPDVRPNTLLSQSGTFADKWTKKLKSTQFSPSSGFGLAPIYDLINSLPILHLQPNIVKIQIPWFEPGILRKIEQSLYKFLFQFLSELVEFLRSFNLPCNITVTKKNLVSKLRAEVLRGRSKFTEAELKQARKSFEQVGKDLNKQEADLSAWMATRGFAKDADDTRKAYFDQQKKIQGNIERLNKRYDELDYQIQRMEQRQTLQETANVLLQVVTETVIFWREQIGEFGQALPTLNPKQELAKDITDEAHKLADILDQPTADALKQCVGIKLGVNLLLDVTGFVKGIQHNIHALQAWKTFPRELAKYLNIVDFYIGQVIKLIDQLTSVIVKWWKDFMKKLDAWIDVIMTFQEFIALVRLLVDILKGYNKQCGLCSSDRLTLKGLILKIVFGVVPKFPIIQFPRWPDIRLDFSDVKLAANVTVPVFDVRPIDIRWPALPKVKFPRFQDLDIGVNGDLKLGLSVKLPKIPLVIPPPPALPPLEPLPDLPKINLPNLPPAPEVPHVLENLLPIMKTIQTILTIWCLINKALIPIDEKVLKTEIENLTNRPLSLILPIDLLLELNIDPGALIPQLVPFDRIDVKTKAKVGVNINPFPDLQGMIDENYHKPMNELLKEMDRWTKELQQSAQKGLDSAIKDPLQDMVNKAKVQEHVDVKQQLQENLSFPDLNSFQSPLDSLFSQKQKALVASHEQLKKAFAQVKDEVGHLKSVAPDDLIASLSKAPSGNVLVSGSPTLLKSTVTKEKSDFVYDPRHFVEKQIALVDKPSVSIALNDAKQNLDQAQKQLFAPESDTIESTGLAVIRSGVPDRLQDYSLENPVVNVWDNDVFLAYDKSVYLKTPDGTQRRGNAYAGNVLKRDLSEFQRSKVQGLSARPIASQANAAITSTIDWSWNSPGVSDVELTLWDSIGKATRLDTDHTRLYLHHEEPKLPGSFVSLEKTLVLSEGEKLQAQKEVRLRFGDDLLTIPPGVQFEIPSLLAREIHFSGKGITSLEDMSQEAWTLDLADQVSARISGLLIMTLPAGKRSTVPAVTKRPFVIALKSSATSALQKRVNVLTGQSVPAGIFYVLVPTLLKDDQAGTTLQLTPGFSLDVSSSDTWTLQSGRGQVMTGTDFSDTPLSVGMSIFPDELLRGELTVRDQGLTTVVQSDEKVVFANVPGPSFEATLPVGNYYGRIRDREGKRGYSEIVLGSASPRDMAHADAQVIAGIERISVPLYTSVSVNGRDFVIGEIADDAFHWQIDGEESFFTGSVFQHPGFDSAGKRTLNLYVRSGEEQVKTKTFELNVFLPALSIDQKLYQNAKILQVQTNPILPNAPIGIVGRRAGVEDWLLTTPDQGTREGDRYRTNAKGLVQMPALSDIAGTDIVIEQGLKVARLFSNGRVILNPDFEVLCENIPMLREDGSLVFRVSCRENGAKVKKFDVRMVPDQDTDVAIIPEFSAYDTGVTLRAVEKSLKLRPADGGALMVFRSNDVPLLLISPDGKLNLSEKSLTIHQKDFVDVLDPVVWQVMDGKIVLLEIQIKGPSNVAIVDAKERDLSPQPSLLGKREGEEVVPPPAKEGVRGRSAFSDVPASSPYSQAITDLSTLGVIKGYSDGKFKPDQAVTRAEALKMLMSVIRCEDCEKPTEKTAKSYDPTLQTMEEFLAFHGGSFDAKDKLKKFAFTKENLLGRLPEIGSYFDVKVSDWYYYCVEIATKLGIIHGYRGKEGNENALGKFIPGRGVNIAELMKMVIESLGKKGKKSTRIFGSKDGWWNDPQNNYLATADEDLKLMIDSSGYSNPTRAATRAEVVYAVARILELQGALKCTALQTKTPSSSPAKSSSQPSSSVTTSTPARTKSKLFSGIEIAQSLHCKCLALVPANLALDSEFFAVITGTGKDSDKVYVKSNTVYP